MITFTFKTTKIKYANHRLLKNELYWLAGCVCFSNTEAVVIVEDIPVVGFLFEIYTGVQSMRESNLNFMLISDHDTYNVHLFKKNNYFTVSTDWGFEVNSFISNDILRFEDELLQVLRQSFTANCLITPKIKEIRMNEIYEKVLLR